MARAGRRRKVLLTVESNSFTSTPTGSFHPMCGVWPYYLGWAGAELAPLHSSTLFMTPMPIPNSLKEACLTPLTSVCRY